jgi:hypothetical protein
LLNCRVCRWRIATLCCGGVSTPVAIWDFHAIALTSREPDMLAISYRVQGRIRPPTDINI